MKNIILILLLGVSITADAQYGARGTYGTLQPFQTYTMNTYNGAGTAKSSGKDTLSGTDTGYVWVAAAVNMDLTFDLYVTTLTGTVTPVAAVLQGATGTSHGLTADWHTVTGTVVYCADCIGASSTTVPGAAKHYIWQVPHSAGGQFNQWRIRYITGGTQTSIYTGQLTTGY